MLSGTKFLIPMSCRPLILSLLSFILCATASAFDTVVLDAGHGGHDRGAAIGYVYEKHLALDTARRVEEILRREGLKVIMTRSRDVFIPLADRAAVGNRYRNALFVSLHDNYNRSGSGAGAGAPRLAATTASMLRRYVSSSGAVPRANIMQTEDCVGNA